MPPPTAGDAPLAAPAPAADATDAALAAAAAVPDPDAEFGFQRAELGKEKLVGTVGFHERHLFLRYKGPEEWPSHFEAAESERLPRLLAAAIKARKPNLKKTTKLTICEGEDGTESYNGDVLIFPDMIRYKGLTHFNVDNFVEEVLVKDTEWFLVSPEAISGSYVFICCHGSRDNRSGVCGPALIKRFKEEINALGLDGKVSVSACSHVGCHKYAGNIIIFRSDDKGEVTGHWYGYVVPDDVPVLLHKHIGEGEIVEHLWRGQMGLSEQQQKQVVELRNMTSAPPVEVLIEDTYREILLRLPADRPQLIHRFSAVSRTWHRLLTDKAFLRAYRRMPNLIGYIYDDLERPESPYATFITTPDATFRPRVPEGGCGLHVLDCRHGRVILGKLGEGFLGESTLIIWDPIADGHQELLKPEAFRHSDFNWTATIMCEAPGCKHLDCHDGPFRVVFVGIDVDKEGGGPWPTHVFGYSSALGSWSPSPAVAIAEDIDFGFLTPSPSTLVGWRAQALYFRSPGKILQYWFGEDGDEQLAYINTPLTPTQDQEAHGTVVMPAPDGKLGFAAMYHGNDGMRIQFWETEVNADASVNWVLTQNSILKLPVSGALLIGVATNSVSVHTKDDGIVSVEVASYLFILTKDDGIVSVDLGSGQFEVLPGPTSKISGLVPFMSYQGNGGFTSCQTDLPKEKQDKSVTFENQEGSEEESDKENGAGSKEGHTETCPRPAWFETWERADTYAAFAVVAAAASMFVAFRIYKNLN